MATRGSVLYPSQSIDKLNLTPEQKIDVALSVMRLDPRDQFLNFNVCKVCDHITIYTDEDKHGYCINCDAYTELEECDFCGKERARDELNYHEWKTSCGLACYECREKNDSQKKRKLKIVN